MIDLILSVDELNYLGTLLPGGKSSVSPFQSANMVSPQAVNIQRLMKLGALNQAGQVSPTTLPAMQVLAQARAYAGFGYVGAKTEFEAAIFFADKRAVGLVNSQAGLRIVDPAPVEAITGALELQIGRSNLSLIDLEATLSVAEALTLASVIDIARRNKFRLFLEQDQNERVNAENLSKWIDRGKYSAQWLTGHLQMYINQKIQFSTQDISHALVELTKNNLVRQDGQGYALGDELNLLINRFLTIDHLIKIQAGRVCADQSIISTEMEIVQGGLNNLLLWELVENNILWKSIAASDLIGMLSGLLTQEDALKSLEGAVSVGTGKASQDAQAACPTCQVPMLANAKFCVSCGSKTEPLKPAESSAGKFCINCGKPIPMGGKFCIGCGKQLS